MDQHLTNQLSTCPAALHGSDCILLAHGEGGRLMRKLLSERIVPLLEMTAMEDAGRCAVTTAQIAVTTDSFVVSPLFFPGGDIGSLAVYGTVNDLAVAGARPVGLTLGLILEEGLSLGVLERILQSVVKAARLCGVRVITGDTKVVPRGAVDKIFINTSGVGEVSSSIPLQSSNIQPGDALIVSGPIGHHGIAVLAAREGLHFNPEPRSDSASLLIACQRLQQELGEDLRTMRDATRGGVSAVLHEWSIACGATMRISETAVPVAADIRGACELLGLDPLYVANEGTFLAAVAANAVEPALVALHAVPVSAKAQVIGEVVKRASSPVVIERMLGALQPLDEPTGAPLPRIC